MSNNKRRKRQNKAQRDLITSEFEKLNQPEIMGKLASDDIEGTGTTGFDQFMKLVKPVQNISES